MFHLIYYVANPSHYNSPSIVISLWLIVGAAFVHPLCFYVMLQRPPLPNDARGFQVSGMILFVATTLIFLSQILLFSPMWRVCTTWEHHGFVAFYLVFAIFIDILVSVWPRVYKSHIGGTKYPWVMASWILAGLTAAYVHLRTLWSTLKTTGLGSSWNYFASFSSSPPIIHHTPPYDTTLGKMHTFIHLGLLLSSVSCILFIRCLLGNNFTSSGSCGLRQELALISFLVICTLALGPGAVGSFVFAMREDSRQIELGEGGS